MEHFIDYAQQNNNKGGRIKCPYSVQTYLIMSKTLTKTHREIDSEIKENLLHHLRETILDHAYWEGASVCSSCFSGQDVMFQDDLEYKFSDYLNENDFGYELSIKLTYMDKEVDLSKFDK